MKIYSINAVYPASESVLANARPLGIREITKFPVYKQKMDSEIIWDILKFPNFEYYSAGCAIFECGAAFSVSPSKLIRYEIVNFSSLQG